MTNDSIHTYSYDAEGNILTVDKGATATYVYDAMKRRVWSNVSSSNNAGSPYEYVYDVSGQRVSSWLEPSNQGNEGRIYWDGQQLAYRSNDGTTSFDHPDYLGTERMRTNSAGAVAATFTSLPWGDGYSADIVDAAAAQDTLQFAGLDADVNSSGATMSEHAQFRNYSFQQGRWLAPDPYDGSYDITNPQSFNRYAYALNNPLSFIDRLGLDPCSGGDGDGTGDPDSGGGDSDGTDPIASITRLHVRAQDTGCDCGPNCVGVIADPPMPIPDPCDDLSCFVGSPVPSSGGAAPNNAVKNLQCAAKYGQAHSIGAALGGGTIANFLGGNSVSSLVNLGLSVSGQQPFSSAPI